MSWNQQAQESSHVTFPNKTLVISIACPKLYLSFWAMGDNDSACHTQKSLAESSFHAHIPSLNYPTHQLLSCSGGLLGMKGGEKWSLSIQRSAQHPPFYQYAPTDFREYCQNPETKFWEKGWLQESGAFRNWNGARLLMLSYSKAIGQFWVIVTERLLDSSGTLIPGIVDVVKSAIQK